MKIARIEIENFRSVKRADIVTADLNIIVGQNNAGKTNVFEAVEWFYKGTPKGLNINTLKWQQNEKNEITVTLHFVGTQAGAEKMTHEANKTKIQGYLKGSDEVSVRRHSAVDKRELLIAGFPVKPGTGFDQALNDFLPKFEYIHTKQYHESVSKYGRTTPIGIMLSGVLGEILDTNEQYKEFQNTFRELFEKDESAVRKEFNVLEGAVQVHLAKQFPDCTSVKFAVRIPEFDDLLKNFDTKLNDGVETTAEEKGDGMQRALMLAIIQTYAEFRRKDEDVGKSFLFFIDEAELHLHPSAQRQLKNVLAELAGGDDQVFINTHSSVLIADDLPKQAFFKAEKGEERETEVVPVMPHEKRYVVYELFGGSPTDLLLPPNFLVVEGAAEVEFLAYAIQRLAPDAPAIQIIPANGDYEQAERSINAIEKIYTPLAQSIFKDKLGVLIDKPRPDKQPGVDAFLNKRPDLKSSGRFVTLPVGSIEEYYPDHDGWRRTPAQVKVMSGKQKTKLARKVGKAISLEQFKGDMPIIWKALESCWNNAFK